MNECKLVEDLLPLYAEELVSQESADFIRDHTAHCDRCAMLLERTSQPVQPLPEDTEAMKNGLRRASRKMVARGLLSVLLITGIFVGLVAGGFTYILWETGAYPVKQVFEAPNVDHRITVADWDTAGFFENGEGSVVTVEVGSSVIRSGKNWENLSGAWSPDSGSFLAVVDLVEGGKGIFLFTGTGEEGDPIRWENWRHENGLVTMLTARCKADPAFPTGWQTVDFSFHAWLDDSETITFLYKTDNGHRGFVDYHYPTDSIIAVD